MNSLDICFKRGRGLEVVPEVRQAGGSRGGEEAGGGSKCFAKEVAVWKNELVAVSVSGHHPAAGK